MMRIPDQAYEYLDHFPRHLVVPHRLMAYPAVVRPFPSSSSGNTSPMLSLPLDLSDVGGETLPQERNKPRSSSGMDGQEVSAAAAVLHGSQRVGPREQRDCAHPERLRHPGAAGEQRLPQRVLSSLSAGGRLVDKQKLILSFRIRVTAGYEPKLKKEYAPSSRRWDLLS